MGKHDEGATADLLGALMTAAKVSPEERAVIAEMADRGVFNYPGFVERCVRAGQLPYVMWRAVKDWARETSDPDLGHLAEDGLEGQGYDETDPPLDVERLQVVLDLDQPKGWVVALWRDIYADHGQTDEAATSLGYLTDQHLCWDCGDHGVTERDHRFWCAACMSTTHKEME